MKELRLPVDFVSFPVGLLQMITAWNMDIEHFISKKERRKTSSSNSQIHSFCLSLCLSGGFSVQAKLPLQWLCVSLGGHIKYVIAAYSDAVFYMWIFPNFQYMCWYCSQLLFYVWVVVFVSYRKSLTVGY